jgi:hypothetical protein
VSEDLQHAADERPDGDEEQVRADGEQRPLDDDEPTQSGDEARPANTGPPRRRASGGSILAAAMLGLRDVLYGKPKEDSVIEIESSGDPPNIDLDGLDEPLGRDHRMIGPPLDDIKSRAHVRRRGSRARGRHPR